MTDSFKPCERRHQARRRPKVVVEATPEQIVAFLTGQAFHDVRALRALNMRRRGLLLDDIAAEFKVTRERARQLVTRGMELERIAASTDPWDELNARIRNGLTRDGCEPTADSVVEHFKTRDWKLVPAMGVKAFATLNAWLVRHGKEPIQ